MVLTLLEIDFLALSRPGQRDLPATQMGNGAMPKPRYGFQDSIFDGPGRTGKREPSSLRPTSTVGKDPPERDNEISKEPFGPPARNAEGSTQW